MIEVIGLGKGVNKGELSGGAHDEGEWRHLMLYDKYRRAGGCEGAKSLSALQEALADSGFEGDVEMEVALRGQLDALSERLERIRSMGGAYSEIEFSGYVKSYLSGNGRRHHRQALVS